MNRPALHTFGRATVGNLFKEEVVGYTVSRSEFLDVVEQTLDSLRDRYNEETLEEVGKAVRATAEFIDRFPFGSWMANRGCGCIVGEALVAADAISRQKFVEDEGRAVNVFSLLQDTYGPTVAPALYDFGCDVDTDLDDYVFNAQGSWPDTAVGYKRVLFIED